MGAQGNKQQPHNYFQTNIINEICDENLPYFDQYSSGEDEDPDKFISNESLSSFITDSPFSFRNPIFFSVPRNAEAVTKKVEPLTSKRHLFDEDDEVKV
jgi:hypothetical protein